MVRITMVGTPRLLVSYRSGWLAPVSAKLPFVSRSDLCRGED